MLDGFAGQGPLFILCLFFLLGLVVVVHELGHYLAGRLFGAAAESFSVGFGRPILERTDSRNTRWRLNWIPLGGFVKFVGEHQLPGDAGHFEAAPVGKPFYDLTVGQRSIVLVAGPLANFVLAILIFATSAMLLGEERHRLTIAEVNPGPAAEAGFVPGDVLLTIDGKVIRKRTDATQKIALSSGTPLDVEIDRGGVPMTLTVVPERQLVDLGLGQPQPIGVINVALSPEALERARYGPFTGIGHGAVRTWETVTLTGRMLGRMVTGRESIAMLSGPVAIGDVSRRVVTNTLSADHVALRTRLFFVVLQMLEFAAIVSIGIGLFNLLPLPVLDGGHLVFNAYEAATGSMLPAKVQEAALTVGLVLLLSVAVVVTWGDIVETGILGAFGA
ncbi:MAG: M50 family metallopeptidase [Pseudomonadota bacterium]